ncbi:hypothetical protein [Saccharomonospora glauca]|uniref:Uncharacterized protein n=1 Tax=Saccharomonospora glauca K62 TaxID=928724 RepID=I1D393_9PSEU|nr:hypothetical protein [Saccharomonospora glauca]EIE99417.1 hypothetical protein SacglDRAFT_02525 [Saccharomonospora glauca K62]
MSTTVRPARRHTRRFVRATLMGVLTLAVVAVPTDIIDTPVFSREIPVRWWEYPVVAATVVLTFAWFAIQGPPPTGRASRRPLGGVLLTVFAVGCPVCNKLVLVALGTSGALGLWAPLQPFLALISLALLALAVVQRRRQSACATGACATPQPTTARQ